jgi:hypothetical protein
MKTETNVALTTPTTTKTEHLNLDDVDPEHTELIALRTSPPARLQLRNSANYYTRSTKRATCQQTPPLVLHP